MPQPSYLPPEVLDSVRNHIRTVINNNIDDFFMSAGEAEPAMTAHLFGALQIKSVAVFVDNGEVRGNWRWSLTYTNFRSSGPHATEDVLGADGIVELHMDYYGDRKTTKSALFQAKMYGKGGKMLLQQCLKLPRRREAAFVINYEPDAVTASTIDDVIAERGRLPRGEHRVEFASFFADEFAACNIGDQQLLYDAARRRLFWRSVNKETVAIQFSVPDRLSLKVRVPRYRRRTVPRADRIITPVELGEHRMLAEPQDILHVPSSAPVEALETARRKQAQKYHPDRFHDLEPEYREIATERMSEISNACDDLKARHIVKR